MGPFHFQAPRSVIVAATSPSNRSPNEPACTPSALSPRVRWIVSVALALHLLAVVTAPMSMDPAAPLWVTLWRGFRPYLEALYLNHGYHFFAPDPGPSHLVRYELDLSDGSTAEGIFPSPQEHAPRLLYHRHFMLSEYANRLAVEDEPTPALKVLSQSFANHLMTKHGATRARLYLRRHYIPTPEQVQTGQPLDAPEFIAERSLGEFVFGASPATVAPTIEDPLQPLEPEPALPEPRRLPLTAEPVFEVASIEELQ